MTTITHRFETRAKPEALWRCLSDLELVQHYNPVVLKASLPGEARKGVGALRQCVLKPKGKVLERVTVWEEGRAVGLEVVESDWPVTEMNWVTRIEPKGDGAVLSQKLDYAMKFGLLGVLLDTLVMKRNVTKNVGEALAGLVRRAEQMA